MHSETSAADHAERIPRIAPGRDPSALQMSPAEGFLLSRIDGNTPWRLLRDIGGIPAEQVDRTLERWLDDGLVVLEGGSGGLVVAGGDRQGAGAERGAVDHTVDLPEALQREILEFEASLPERNYFQLLGVGRDADSRAIKKAYFALSKKVHPDRYFRREIGAFDVRLERIFKGVMEAYELLSDPTTRAEIEKGFAEAPPPEPEPVVVEEVTPEVQRPQRKGYRVPSRMENLQRLRKRFRPPEKLVAERRIKAQQFFEAARTATEQQRWLEAAASARLAIAFDPWNPEYKTGFVEVQAHVNRERAVLLLEEARDSETRGEAMRLLEEAINYRPLDHEANARAADLALSMNDLDRALEYATAAVEIEPEAFEYQLLSARVLRRTGDMKAAKLALKAAFRLAPDDPGVAAERRLQNRKA
jgi:curved DNA-binding protein CbpA